MANGYGERLDKLKIRGMKIVLTLQKGTFPANGGSNTKTIYATSLPEYLHADVVLTRLPAWLGNNAIVTIYGMTLEDCFAATKFNSINVSYYNQVQVFADYINPEPNQDGSFSRDIVTAACDKLPLVFMGQILSATPDLNDTNRPFVIQANVAVQSVTVVNSPISINESTNFSDAVQSIINVHNNSTPEPQIIYKIKGVSPDQIVNNAHYTGSVTQNIQNICNDYGYQFNIIMIDDTTQQLEFTKIGLSNSKAPFVLNSGTGMQGYPIAMPFGIAVKEYFNPRRNINDTITLDTYFTPLVGDYYVWQMQSFLQTMGESWDTTLTLYGFDNSAYGA